MTERGLEYGVFPGRIGETNFTKNHREGPPGGVHTVRAVHVSTAVREACVIVSEPFRGRPNQEVIMDLTMFINAALSAAGGGGVVGALVLSLYKHSLKQEQEQREADRRERAALSEKLERLENEKFAALQKKVDDHLEADKPGEVALQFRHLNGTLTKLTDKLDKVAEDVTALKTESKENKDFTRNLYNSMQKLREEVYRGKP